MNITVFIQHSPGNWLSDALLSLAGTRFCEKISCDSFIMDVSHGLIICERQNRDSAVVRLLSTYVGHIQTSGWRNDVAKANARESTRDCRVWDRGR